MQRRTTTTAAPKQKTIFYRITQSYFLLVAVLLVVTGTLMLPTQLQSLNTALDKHIAWTAYLISQNEQVIAELAQGQISPALQANLAGVIQSSGEIDYIVLADADSIRRYHPDATRIGQPFVGGDERAVLTDATPYITTGQGSEDRQRRAFHQIAADDGTVLGFVLVSASLSTVRNAQYRLAARFLLLFAVLLAVGMLFAYLTARRIRRSLLGYEPDTFTRMFLQREEILDNLDEGLVAYDTAGQQHYANPTALKLLDGKPLAESADGRALLTACLQKKQALVGLPFEGNGNSLLLSFLPLQDRGTLVGALAILRDRTETIQMAEQLTGADHIVEALRGNTHEYLNKLHILSGMLQMGEYEQAISFIDGISREARSSYQTVIKQIHNKTIAALLLGKQSHAKELGIDFTIQKESFLEAHNDFLSTQELVTIIGNLVENAFRAVEHSAPSKQVQIFISQTADGLTVISDDTGCGMTPEQIDKIYQGGFTTKGEGHGIGLRLIQEIIKKHEGYLTIESEPDTGSIFTISISQKRGRCHD